MRKRWWILGAMGAATAALVVSGTVWWHSTADLDDVADRARAMGIPPTYEDIPNPEIADPAEVAALTAIEGLAEPLMVLSVFSEDDNLDGDLYERTGRSGRPPDPLDIMLMSHTGVAVERLRRAIEALPDRAVRAGPMRSHRDARAWISSLRSGVNALTPWVRWGGDPVGDLARLTRLAETQPIEVWIDELVAISVRSIVLNAAAGRIRDIPADAPMVAIWGRWADAPVLNPAVVAQEFRLAMGMYRELGAQDLVDMPFNPAEGLTWTVTAALRLGRAGALHAQLDLIVALGATTAPAVRRALVAEADARCNRVANGWRRRLLDPAGWNQGLLTPAMTMIGTMAVKQRIFAALLVALIRGEPIPVDPTDPAGKPLRRYERNGELIGYYACGDDGVDNGGTLEDWQFAFDRPWDPPAP
jgi:hypothetical protein